MRARASGQWGAGDLAMTASDADISDEQLTGMQFTAYDDEHKLEITGVRDCKNTRCADDCHELTLMNVNPPFGKLTQCETELEMHVKFVFSPADERTAEYCEGLSSLTDDPSLAGRSQ